MNALSAGHPAARCPLPRPPARGWARRFGDEAMSKAMAFIRCVGHTQLDASSTGARAAPRCAAGHLVA
jgi:hypothetical protein